MTSTRVARGRVWRARLLPVLVVLLAALASGAAVWTLHGRQSSRAAVPVALVNTDVPVTTGTGKAQKTVAAGRQLAAGLTQPAAQDTTPLSWQLVDADDAAAGLRDGSFYAVLTIPETFSTAITSTSGTQPAAARLQLTTDDASSAAVAALTQLAVTRAAAELGDQATRGFVDSTLSSLTTISTNLSGSARSADTLADSSRQLAASSADLASGSASLGSGAADLADGASQTSNGADQLASGTSSLDTAAGRLARGARTTAAGAASASTGAGRVAAGTRALARATQANESGLHRLGRASGRTARAGSRVADRARQVAAGCPEAAGTGYCAEVRRLALATAAEAGAVRAVDAGIDTAARRAGRIADGAAASARSSGRLADATGAVADGTAGVSSGAEHLHRAAGSLASAAGDLATGASSLADGATANARAAHQLAAGAVQLDDGADRLDDGADSLASGLHGFAKSVPGYSTSERNQLDDVVTTPVVIDARTEHDATVEAGLTPTVLATMLWLASLMLFLVRAAVPTAMTWAQAPVVRRVLAGWLPAVGVGVALTAVLLVLVAVAGVPVHSPVGVVLICALGACAFAATNQALVAAFGPVGRMVGLAVVLVEAAAVGGIIPIETAPTVFRVLNGVLPLPRFVDAANQLVLGGAGGGLPVAVVILAGWTVVSLLVTANATRRRRPVPPDLRTRPAREVVPDPGGPTA